MTLREAYNVYVQAEFEREPVKTDSEFEQLFVNDEIGLAYTDYYYEEERVEIPIQVSWNRKTKKLNSYVDGNSLWSEDYSEETLIETLISKQAYDCLISDVYSKTEEMYGEE